MVQVAIVNGSSVVQDADVQDSVAALQIQVSRDFAPIWGRDAQLAFSPRNTPVPGGTWELLIADNSDQAGDLGYHELTVNGDPLGKVFAQDDIANGNSWTVTASHELLEMLADPWINQCVQNNKPDGSIRFYALEICDACEDDLSSSPTGFSRMTRHHTISKAESTRRSPFSRTATSAIWMHSHRTAGNS